MGFIQATPGEMKSLRSSADKIALIVGRIQVVQYTGTDYKRTIRFICRPSQSPLVVVQDFRTYDKYLYMYEFLGGKIAINLNYTLVSYVSSTNSVTLRVTIEN